MHTNAWQSGSTYANRYYNAFTYDANGNILTQTRYAENGTQIEDMTYQYNRNTNGKMLQNRLYHVNDNVVTAITDDIEDQGVFNSNNSTMNTTNNYGYDGEGRLVRDNAEEIASITWTVTGKVKEVIRTSGSTKKNLKFRYDASGQRIAKEVYDSNNNWEKTTYYVRDPQGNVMGIYEKTMNAQLLSCKIVERNIYGSSMVGLVKSDVELISGGNPSTISFAHFIGEKQYYFSNHLQSVSTVVSDLALVKDWNGDNIADFSRAEIISAVDFYSFGYVQTERSFNSNEVRAGHNGKEKDDEINVEGGCYDFGARVYESRLGKFLSLDAYWKKFTSTSPYMFAGNSPISCIEVNGDSLYILAYTTGNGSADDEMFYASALTRKKDIESSPGFDPARDKVVLLPVTDLGKIKSSVEQTTNEYSPTYGGTVEFDMWSHAGYDGPVGTEPTSTNAMEGTQMTVEGWSQIDFNWVDDGKGARANFYGCRTGQEQTVMVADPYGGMYTEKVPSFVQNLSGLSNFNNVAVAGQSKAAYPSMYTDYRTASPSPEGDFIKSESDSKVVFLRTYLVAGTKQIEGAALLKEQNVAFKLNVYQNGKSKGSAYQPGDTKPKQPKK